ncbi:MAG: 50S ribosomal protein L15 [Aestuariivita sp.]|nr:50S ribosomal protein L15 [Aestuariivita sp.]MCY4203541.1 50S ribosomal protein L15 [Aestuariivita sp.]
MKLNQLHDNPGATHRRKRVGRGPGSGKGKTAGRGMKGQKSRSGVAINGFEGGQMPLYQRLPKRGFTKPNRKRYATVNLGKLESFIARDKINPKAIITEEILVQSGIVNRRHDGIRILAGGELSTKLSIEVTGASKAAIANVEKAGGSLTLIARGKSSMAVEQQL